MTILGKELSNGIKSIAFATLIAGAGMVSAPVHAEDDGFPGEFSANTTIASEYIFRGVSVSDEELAIQGSIDWSHESGFYVGTWGSSAKIGEEGNAEFNHYAGYGGDIGDTGFTFDLNTIFYNYPGDGVDGNYIEFGGSIGRDFGIVSTAVGVAYVPTGQDAWGGNDVIYIFGDTEVPIPNTPLTAGFHLGYEDFGQGSNKLDWSAGLYANIEGLDIGVAYVDTDVKGDNTNARVLFTIGKSF